MKPIYLDYNATTPILPEVAEAMLPFLSENFGNPSSSHWYGKQARLAVEQSRQQVADLLHCKSDEVIFTSGGSESNNFAIKGIAFANKEKGNHIITSSIEHPAVIKVCRFLESQHFKVTYLPVDEYGLVNIDELKKSITPQTILISIMHANNEVGTIQPIKEISEIARKHDIILHSDAAQSVGKIDTNVKKMDVDLLSVAGHKYYAPKGIGALYIRHGVRLQKFIHGADHEQNMRAGTENILEITGIGKASEIARGKLDQNNLHLKYLRNLLGTGILNGLKDINVNEHPLVKVNGHPEKRLPNTLSVSFYGMEANKIISKIEPDLAVSAGAACHSDGITISETLKAMDVSKQYAMGTIRLSTGQLTTKDEIEKAVKVIVSATNQILS